MLKSLPFMESRVPNAHPSYTAASNYAHLFLLLRHVQILRNLTTRWWCVLHHVLCPDRVFQHCTKTWSKRCSIRQLILQEAVQDLFLGSSGRRRDDVYFKLLLALLMCVLNGWLELETIGTGPPLGSNHQGLGNEIKVKIEEAWLTSWLACQEEIMLIFAIESEDNLRVTVIPKKCGKNHEKP